MTDAPAFFRAIEAEPDDDTPRLVFADWLEERATSDADRARAEFVRLQCEASRAPNEAKRLPLEERAEQLLAAHGPAWAAWPLKLHDPIYIRGFLDPVAAGHMFTRHAAHLAELMPLHHLRLFKARIGMEHLAACPQLALVRRLTLLGNVLRNEHMTAFATSPHLGNLRHLDLSENRIGVRGATDLAAANPPAVRALGLAGNPIRDRGLLALALADWTALDTLDVSQCGLTGPGVSGFATTPLARRLVSLQMSRNPVVSAGNWRTLAAAPMERLQRLDLSSPGVTDEVVEALAANAALTRLRVLHLGAANTTDRAARAVLGSPTLRKLKRLRLPAHHIDAPLLKKLRDAFGTGFNPRG